MAKVFLVCETGWEHHHVLAAFTTKKAAAKFLDERLPKSTNSDNSYDVEDYDLNKIPVGYPLRKRRK